MRRRRLSEDAGFAYIALLFAVAMIEMTVAGAMWVWSSAMDREREAELLQIGSEIRNAIARYYENTPGSIKRYPPSLSALIRDERQPMVMRYLRRIYRDPFLGTTQWGIVRAPDGGVMGIYSNSTKRPLRTVFEGEDSAFIGTSKYSDWQFVYLAPAAATSRNVE